MRIIHLFISSYPVPAVSMGLTSSPSAQALQLAGFQAGAKLGPKHGQRPSDIATANEVKKQWLTGCVYCELDLVWFGLGDS